VSAAGAPPVPYRAKRTARDENHGSVHLTIKAAHLLDELALALPSRSQGEIVELALRELLHGLLK